MEIRSQDVVQGVLYLRQQILMRYTQLLILLVVIATIPSSALADAKGESRQLSPSLPESKELAASPKSTNPELELGWRAYQRGDPVEALNRYLAATKLSPTDASVWHDLGCLYAMNQDRAKAREALEKSLQLNPASASTLDALGQLDEVEGHTGNARERYAAAVNLEPANAKFLRHHIRVLLLLNKTDEVRAALKQLLASTPTDIEARYELAVLELRAGVYDLAAHDFQRVVDQSPKHVMAWNGLGLSRAHSEDFEGAIKALERAAMLETNNPHTQTNLGLVAAYQQRWEDARTAWKRALAIDADFSPAVKNLQVLDAAQPSINP